jgi:hypothetical protein
MAENLKTAEPTIPVTPVAPGPPVTPPVPPKRSPGHRGADVKDTVAEMAAKAHEISLEAGSKMAAAMKDVINAAAGLSGFVIESARDLVQYMVRRGQMTQEEADKLIREVEAALPKRKAPAPSHSPAKPGMAQKAPPSAMSAKKAASKPALKAPTPKSPPKAAAEKHAAKKPALKKPSARKPTPKKSAPAKGSGKKGVAKKAKRR